MISSSDFAARLGVSQATVSRAVTKGVLRPTLVTPGGHRRFSELDLVLWGSPVPNELGGARLLSTGEAARLLGVSQPTLNRAVRRGLLQPAFTTPGGHRRFNSAAFRSDEAESKT